MGVGGKGAASRPGKLSQMGRPGQALPSYPPRAPHPQLSGEGGEEREGVLSEGPGGLTPAGGCNCHLQREWRGSAPDGRSAIPGVPWDARFFTSGLSRCPHPCFSLDEALPQPQSQPQDGSALLSAVLTPAAW